MSAEFTFPDAFGATTQQLEYVCDATEALLVANADATDIEDPRSFFLRALYSIQLMATAVLGRRSSEAVDEDLRRLVEDGDRGADWYHDYD